MHYIGRSNVLYTLGCIIDLSAHERRFFTRSSYFSPTQSWKILLGPPPQSNMQSDWGAAEGGGYC